MSNYHYFSDEEVAKWKLDPELWAMLDMARDKAGVPFIITSGRRTPDQNACLHGAVADSSHLSGLGVDLSTSGDDHIKERITYGLCAAGFVRRGIYYKDAENGTANLIPHHIHVDIDKTKPQEVEWSLRELNA